MVAKRAHPSSLTVTVMSYSTIPDAGWTVTQFGVPESRPSKRARVDSSTSDGGQRGSNPRPNANSKGKNKLGRPQRSCAECKRSRIKCNGVVPCELCTKRGCAAICPTGTLVSVKDSRHAFVNPENPHMKMQQMSMRIQELEGALAVAHSIICATNTTQHSTPAHSLLSAEYAKIKDLSSFYELRPDQPNEQALGSSEAALLPVDPMAAPWNTTQNLDVDFHLTGSLAIELVTGEPTEQIIAVPKLDLPASLLKETSEFSTKWKECLGDFDSTLHAYTKTRLHHYLRHRPLEPWEDNSIQDNILIAIRRCQAAVRHSFWMFNYAIDAPSVEILLAQIYDEQRDVDSGDLALVLMLLSIGAFLNGYFHEYLFLMSRTILYTSIDAAVATADHRILQCLFLQTSFLFSLSEEEYAARQSRKILGWLSEIIRTIIRKKENIYEGLSIKGALELRILFWEIRFLDSIQSIEMFKKSALEPGLFVNLDRPSLEELSLIFHSRMEQSCIDSAFKFVENLAAPLIAITNMRYGFELHKAGYDMNRTVDLDNEIRQCFDVESIFGGGLASGGDEFLSDDDLPLVRISLTQIRELCILHLHRIVVAEYLDDLEDMPEHGLISMLATVRSASAVRLEIKNYPGPGWRIWTPSLCRTVLYLMDTLITVVRFMHPNNPICAFALEEMILLLETISGSTYFREMNSDPLERLTYRAFYAILISLDKTADDDTEEYESINKKFNKFMHRIFPKERLQIFSPAAESSNRDGDYEEMIVSLAAKLNPELKIFTRTEILSPKSWTSAQSLSIAKKDVERFLVDLLGCDTYTEKWRSMMKDGNSLQCKNDIELERLQELAGMLRPL